MGKEMEVAVAQMTSVDDVDINLNQIQSLLVQIFSNAQPQLVLFPENCLYMRIIEGEKIHGFSLQHPCFIFLSSLAKKYKTHLHLGSVPLLLEGQLYNSSVLVNPQGVVTPTYQKIHLFDIQLEGQKAIRESDVFNHGEEPQVLEIKGWKIGQTICYDLRFAELFSHYAAYPVDVLLVPSAFLVKTGEAHWEVLLRARAIESQAYVLASAQGGAHHGVKGGSRQTYGHSLIVDPWGLVVARVARDECGFIVAKLSLERIQSVRRQIPMKSHRRLSQR